jgi:hypothetical protein
MDPWKREFRGGRSLRRSQRGLRRAGEAQLGEVIRHHVPIHASRNCYRYRCDHRGYSPAGNVEIRGAVDDNGVACGYPAMAGPSRDHRGGSGLHVPLWPKPEGRALALGDVGQHPGGIAVDGQFHAVSFWKKTVETRRPTEPIPIGPSFGVPK